MAPLISTYYVFLSYFLLARFNWQGWLELSLWSAVKAIVLLVIRYPWLLLYQLEKYHSYRGRSWRCYFQTNTIEPNNPLSSCSPDPHFWVAWNCSQSMSKMACQGWKMRKIYRLYKGFNGKLHHGVNWQLGSRKTTRINGDLAYPSIPSLRSLDRNGSSGGNDPKNLGRAICPRMSNHNLRAISKLTQYRTRPYRTMPTVRSLW